MDEQQKPEVYVRNYCGYCYQVLLAIRQLDADVEIRNIWADENSRDALQRATGGNRVPVLHYVDEMDNEQWMPESRDILRWLEKRFGKPA